jgi:hypothetical protein
MAGPADDGREAIAVVVPASTPDRDDATATGTANTGGPHTSGATPRNVNATGPVATVGAASSPAATTPPSDQETAAEASPPPSAPPHAGAHKDKLDTADRAKTIGGGRKAQPPGLTEPPGHRPSVPPGHTRP